MEKDIEAVRARVRTLVHRLLVDELTESERIMIGEELDQIVPDPEFTGYIFYPELELNRDDLIEAAIERAFNYKPIVL